MTKEEQDVIRAKYKELMAANPMFGSHSAGIHSDGYMKNYEMEFKVDFLALLYALDRTEVRMESMERSMKRPAICWDFCTNRKCLGCIKLSNFEFDQARFEKGCPNCNFCIDARAPNYCLSCGVKLLPSEDVSSNAHVSDDAQERKLKDDECEGYPDALNPFEIGI